MKYPLLLRQVVKFSSGTSSAEIQLLSLVIQKLESVLQRVDSSMAEAKCQFTISRVCFFVLIILILDLVTILGLKQQILTFCECSMTFFICQLEWLDEAVEVRCHAVRKAREEMLDGTLRNNRGTVKKYKTRFQSHQ